MEPIKRYFKFYDRLRAQKNRGLEEYLDDKLEIDKTPDEQSERG
jgi:hypothetical protein